MTKKVVLALGCLALLVAMSNAAMADLITFNFVFSPNPVAVDTSGLVVTNAVNISVSDANSMVFAGLAGTASLSTGPASSYSNSGGILSAIYSAGGAVSVLSASCTGGLHPGVCLSGMANGNGTYASQIAGQTESFQGLFTVTYVSPYITGLFTLPNTWDPGGSDSITTGLPKILTRTTANAILGGGTISFTTPVPVPEPGTLALLGTGVLGLTGFVRRKLL